MGESGEPLVFEVEAPPSGLRIVIDQIHGVSLFDVPIIALLLFFAVWTVILWKCRHNIVISSVQFLLSCYGIYATASLNAYFAARWDRLGFSRNYFDPRCEFALTFWGLPMILVSSAILLIRFADLCKAMIVHRYFNSIISKRSPEKVKTE